MHFVRFWIQQLHPPAPQVGSRLLVGGRSVAPGAKKTQRKSEQTERRSRKCAALRGILSAKCAAEGIRSTLLNALSSSAKHEASLAS
mmetsp:Transcript_65268/g.121689  ORF Transcript_65268/g.121689 Transcript_65268/m.121689 type:complete len:87 (-) Transcript_65268:8-268(-)